MNAALEQAWNDVASKLRGYIRSRVRDHAAAEDLLQDVFVKAHGRANQIGELRSGNSSRSATGATTEVNQVAEVRNLEGWLFLITRNAVVDHFRRTKPTEELPEEVVAPAEAESEGLENVEGLRAAFRNMVFTLPEPYREALVLTEFEGLTQRELASRLGISVSGAKSRVQRGREQLKDSLLECCQLEFDRRGNVIECEPRKSDCKCN